MDKPVAPIEAHILLSEDDPAVRRSIQLLLRSRGYDVRAYTSGSALLSDPQARTGTCLIVDYRMPDVDGIAMLRRLRSEGWRGAAILMTGYYDSELARRATEEGFDAVLRKPLGDQVLLETIALLFGPPRREAGRQPAPLQDPAGGELP